MQAIKQGSGRAEQVRTMQRFLHRQHRGLGAAHPTNYLREHPRSRHSELFQLLSDPTSALDKLRRQ
jgi:hypothetical protein